MKFDAIIVVDDAMGQICKPENGHMPYFLIFLSQFVENECDGKLVWGQKMELDSFSFSRRIFGTSERS